MSNWKAETESGTTYQGSDDNGLVTITQASGFSYALNGEKYSVSDEELSNFRAWNFENRVEASRPEVDQRFMINSTREWRVSSRVVSVEDVDTSPSA